MTVVVVLPREETMGDSKNFSNSTLKQLELTLIGSTKLYSEKSMNSLGNSI